MVKYEGLWKFQKGQAVGSQAKLGAEFYLREVETRELIQKGSFTYPTGTDVFIDKDINGKVTKILNPKVKIELDVIALALAQRGA